MFPRIVLAASALALSASFIAPTTARAKAVTGSVSCTLTGSAAISPGLPATSPGNATKKLKTTTTFNGTLSDCTGTQTGTKGNAQIDGGMLTAVAKTTTAVGQPLPSCAGLTAPTAPTILKAKVTFTSGGKAVATSKANLTVGAAVINGSGDVSFPALGAVSGGNAFKGQNATATAILDKGALDLATLCTGGASITFEFTGLKGTSTFDVAP